jgi:hypothetical protein
MMPVFEPEIEAAIQWENPEVQNGQKTLPIGPIMWEQGEDGAIKAVAVGSEKGAPRRRTVFTIPNPVGKKGQPIPVTPIAESEFNLTTVGTHTQPPPADDANVEDTPPADSPSPTATPASVEDTSLPLRQGTSESRYEQQEHTHGAGQLSEGTPHAAVNDHGHGDKTVTMEPSTVGQAPKDVSIPTQEPPAPGYVEQAQQVAGQAATAVTSTVASATSAVAGLVGGSKAEKEVEEKVPEKSEEQKKMEAEIDGKDNPVIEGFLRTQTMTGAGK